MLGLQDDAKAYSIPISVGIHEPSDDAQSKRIKNTLIWIDEKGEIAHRYQKIHLFDLELDGGPVMKESNTIEPGNSILAPFETVVGKVGSMICFDLRFLGCICFAASRIVVLVRARGGRRMVSRLCL